LNALFDALNDDACESGERLIMGQEIRGLSESIDVTLHHITEPASEAPWPDVGLQGRFSGINAVGFFKSLFLGLPDSLVILSCLSTDGCSILSCRRRRTRGNTALYISLSGIGAGSAVVSDPED